jgi:hypothetical protein
MVDPEYVTPSDLYYFCYYRGIISEHDDASPALQKSQRVSFLIVGTKPRARIPLAFSWIWKG